MVRRTATFTSAEDDDLAALRRRQAAEQLALAAGRLMQQMGADLNRDAPCDDRHRSEQWQRTVGVLDRFECDAGQADVEQAARQLRIGCEMEVTEQQMILAQQLEVAGDRFLHLDDEFADLVELPCRRHQRDAEARVLFIGKAALFASALLHEHLMTATHEVTARGGNEGDTPFEGLDFRRHTDTHDRLRSDRGRDVGNTRLAPARRARLAT